MTHVGSDAAGTSRAAAGGAEFLAASAALAIATDAADANRSCAILGGDSAAAGAVGAVAGGRGKADAAARALGLHLSCCRPRLRREQEVLLLGVAAGRERGALLLAGWAAFSTVAFCGSRRPKEAVPCTVRTDGEGGVAAGAGGFAAVGAVACVPAPRAAAMLLPATPARREFGPLGSRAASLDEPGLLLATLLSCAEGAASGPADEPPVGQRELLEAPSVQARCALLGALGVPGVTVRSVGTCFVGVAGDICSFVAASGAQPSLVSVEGFVRSVSYTLEQRG